MKPEAFRPRKPILDQRQVGVRTPLKVDEWATLLRDHLDEDFVDYLIHGMRFGFSNGYNRASKMQTSRRIMRSAAEHATIVSDYLRQELEQGYVLGPFDTQGFGF